MSAAPVLPLVLPLLQARAEFVPSLRREQQTAILHRIQAAAAAPSRPAPRPQLAFYRKYTEGILRRYMRMSLELGKVPSPLGRGEMFRAKVSNYRVESFEDLVIFCADVERCLGRLTAQEQLYIDTIAIKQYTALEAEPVLHVCRQTIVRQYTRALDRLTGIFLETEILNLSK